MDTSRDDKNDPVSDGKYDWQGKHQKHRRLRRQVQKLPIGQEGVGECSDQAGTARSGRPGSYHFSAKLGEYRSEFRKDTNDGQLEVRAKYEISPSPLPKLAKTTPENISFSWKVPLYSPTKQRKSSVFTDADNQKTGGLKGNDDGVTESERDPMDEQRGRYLDEQGRDYVGEQHGARGH